MEINFAKLVDNAMTPFRKHVTDAGLDLFAVGHYVIDSGAVAIIKTGITFEIPEGMVGLIWPKSRNDYLVGGGVVDSGYQGEILVKVINPLRNKITIGDGSPVAQILFQPVIIPELIGVPREFIHVKETPRAATGGILSEEKGTAVLTSDAYILDEGDYLGWWSE